MDTPRLNEFCRDQRPQLVGAMASYCGDGHLAEEIANEALLRVSERWDEVSEMRAPGPWVHRVAVNLTNSTYRRRRTERRVLPLLGVRDEHSDPDPADRVAVRQALEKLPPRQRAAVAMRYLLDWPVADVAAALETTESAVKSLTHRGLEALRDHFDDGSTSRRVAVAGTAVVVVLAAVVAAVALAGIRSPEPISIEPAPGAEEQPEARPAPPHTGGVVLDVTGDLEGRYVLEGQGSGYDYGYFENPRNRFNVRWGATDRMFLAGEVPRPETATGEGLRITLVLDGTTFRSTAGECTVTILDATHSVPDDPTSGLRSADGEFRCTNLTGFAGDSDRTIDVEGEFRKQAGTPWPDS